MNVNAIRAAMRAIDQDVNDPEFTYKLVPYGSKKSGGMVGYHIELPESKEQLEDDVAHALSRGHTTVIIHYKG